jgi:hypothetical protein
MALKAGEAKRNVQREVVLKSNMGSGFPDRTYVYSLTINGKIEIRQKNTRKKRVVKIEDFIKWSIIHVPEQDS